MVDEEHELTIIGAGPGGLSAVIYGERSGLETIILEEKTAGGMAAEAPLVDNYPGLEEIKGVELMGRMKKHARKYTEIRELHPVRKIEKGDSIFVETDEKTYATDALIIATGTDHRKLNVPGEDSLEGKGVSYCATCDGYFFKNRSVLVVGGGNTALADATYLLNLGCDVTLIHRRNELRAEKALQEGFLEGGGRVIWNSVLEGIEGDETVQKVRLRDLKEDTESKMEVDGVFVSIGEYPRSELASDIGVELDDSGYIKTDEKQRTNIPRVYAAGDVTGGTKQIVVACAEGAIAALSAYEDVRNPYWVK
ncbi:thioredoxin reductase [candidate division MSBL1 archaeon SCGC-AAA261D19]|uniref:Thioredoxin reductase n=1 Tax=candidate division MSBL1 archaeon SCGC-AAA261D19 TaxID=1698273 RepID=A0A133V8L5_9EURY|nr:thioredoxin reductase [candidate division MSBL1 archaeon SCGC-AAA261D19]